MVRTANPSSLDNNVSIPIVFFQEKPDVIRHGLLPDSQKLTIAYCFERSKFVHVRQ